MPELFAAIRALDAPRFRNQLSLGFAPGDLAALDGGTVTPACVGLLGAAGALPYLYTERIARASDDGPRAFLDLLSSGALRQFVEAWRGWRPECAPGAGFLPLAAAPSGVVRARMLAERLAVELDCPVRIGQFYGTWAVLSPAERCALGRRHTSCGDNATLGERLWRRDRQVLMLLGPLDGAQAAALSPGSEGALRLRHWWRAHGAAGVVAEVRLLLAPGVARATVLGRGQRLGHDSFLLTGPAGAVRDDVRYRLSASIGLP